MEAFKNYVLQNWILILVLVAFIIILATTAFLDKKSTRRLYILIASVFALSICVFTEFYLEEDAKYKMVRTVLMSIRYSATPFIIAQIIYSLVERIKKYVAETKYTCSIGYSYCEGKFEQSDDLLKASDEQMYLDKAEFYKNQK